MLPLWPAHKTYPPTSAVESGHNVKSLPTAASLIDLSFNLALNLSKKGFGFLATIHAAGNQHISVSSENYSEYWQTFSWRIVNGSGDAGHKFSRNRVAEGEIMTALLNVGNGWKAEVLGAVKPASPPVS